jgi:hypothetical protein
MRDFIHLVLVSALSFLVGVALIRIGCYLLGL